ncbi:hypothetical protein FKR81_19430 [Lentzea tibetensis]|uniref:Uncharacterized protein n=1 Tax=Lentzea tibetensis TaxID=2591470 RepID=A0A563ESY1_9PSEU|nr:hypothetical protein [Lentzea tibetensis]TWP50776.1 hypothetical protein FKR81_19430 [Lentzea tibetensis]
MAQSKEDSIRQTYLGLRLAMIVLVALLFLSIVVQAVTSRCLQDSVSAYYYTPVRAVFIGTLCAIGACLIIYRGNTDRENVLLDYSGFLAFIVAFVPTEVNESCPPSYRPGAELPAAIGNNVGVAFVMGFVAAGAALLLKWLRPASDSKLSPKAKVLIGLALGLLTAGLLFFLLARDAFEDIGHGAAAIAFFVGIIAVVVLNAMRYAKDNELNWYSFKNKYFDVAVAMAVTLVVCGVAAAVGFGPWLFFLQVLLIGEFVVFWSFQTNELRGKVTGEQA